MKNKRYVLGLVLIMSVIVALGCGPTTATPTPDAGLANPALHLDELVTHTFALEAYQEALALAATGHDRALKVAFTFASRD